MGFTILPNQPINLLPPQADPCNVGDGKEYAMLANIGDDLYLQIGQEPCGENLLCEPDFIGIGEQILTNGSFTGSASGWTLGTGWAYGDGYIYHTPYGGGSVTQTGLTFTSGVSYDITISWTDWNFDALWVEIGTSVGAAAVITRTGTFGSTTVRITPSTNETDFSIRINSGFDGHITNIEIRDVLDCWTYDTSWTYSDCGLTHIPGSTTDLVQWYTRTQDAIRLVVTVSNMTTGYLYVDAFGGAPFTIYANGTYEENYYGGSAGFVQLFLRPSTDFDGCVVSVEIFDLVWPINAVFRRQDYADDGTPYYTDVISDLSYNATANKSDGTLNIKIPTTGLAEGCYQVCLLDPCPHMTEATMSEEMSPDVGFDDGGVWNTGTDSGGATAFVSGGSLYMTCDHDYENNRISVYGIYNYPFADGYYQIDWEVETGDIDADVSGSSLGFFLAPCWGSVGQSTVGSPILENPQPNTTYSGSLFVHIGGSAGAHGGYFGVRMGSDAGTFATSDVNELKSASFIIRNAYDADPASADYTYCSNIINLSTSHDCTKLITGTFPEDTTALGLNFNSNFKLQQRLRTLRFNPFYPTDSNDYEYSDGTRSKTFAKREKYYDVIFDYMGETEHDTISTQVLCDTFTIDGTEYFVKGEDYKPEWDKEGRQRLAQGRMAMRKKSSTIFRNNK